MNAQNASAIFARLRPLTIAAGIFLLLGLLLRPTPLLAAQGASPRRAMAVPVRVEELGKGDFTVYFSSLGTVTANNTVLVRSRVDGQLMKLHFKEGDMVKAGDLLAEIDARPFQAQLEQARGQLLRDEALLRNARQNLARTKVLRKQDSATPQALDNDESLARQYEGAVQNDQGTIDSTELQLEYCRITAPISGRLGLRAVDEGNMVQASDSTGIVTITQVQPVSLLFTVTDAQLPEVREAIKKDPALEVEAWDRSGAKLLATGKLVSLDNQIDTATGTLKLKAEFPNQDDSLFPNQFVNAKIRVRVLRGVCIAPAAAVQIGQQGNFVYTVDKTGADTSVALRPVKVGPADDNRSVIVEGASPGELVVVEGLDQLGPGSLVNAAKASPNGQLK